MSAPSSSPMPARSILAALPTAVRNSSNSDMNSASAAATAASAFLPGGAFASAPPQCELCGYRGVLRGSFGGASSNGGNVSPIATSAADISWSAASVNDQMSPTNASSSSLCQPGLFRCSRCGLTSTVALCTDDDAAEAGGALARLQLLPLPAADMLEAARAFQFTLLAKLHSVCPLPRDLAQLVVSYLLWYRAPGDFALGDLVDARDCRGRWALARVADVSQATSKVLVHFVATGACHKWDSWIPMHSDRLAPCHTQTKGERHATQHDESTKLDGAAVPQREQEPQQHIKTSLHGASASEHAVDPPSTATSSNDTHFTPPQIRKPAFPPELAAASSSSPSSSAAARAPVSASSIPAEHMPRRTAAALSGSCASSSASSSPASSLPSSPPAAAAAASSSSSAPASSSSAAASPRVTSPLSPTAIAAARAAYSILSRPQPIMMLGSVTPMSTSSASAHTARRKAKPAASSNGGPAKEPPCC